MTRRRAGHFFAGWREIAIFFWAIVATVSVIILAILFQHHISSVHRTRPQKSGSKRNLIFMVSDGMGPASLSMARSYRQLIEGLTIDDVLVLDKHLIGSSRTRSSDSLVTDSAAGATAFACGVKSYNGAIAVLPDRKPCGTLLEAAKQAGYMTGVVVYTRITDATPASFVSHVTNRWQENAIAEQEVGSGPLGRVVDLMLGGGKCHFLPRNMSGSCRRDDKDLIKLAQERGFTFIGDRKGFDGLELGKAATLPLLGLFSDDEYPFQIDRRFEEDVYPSLDEMVRTALGALTHATKDSEKGFFLLIEGSLIDLAGHFNDPAAQVHEVVEYDKVFASVLRFLDEGNVDGIVVSTSDHETGGLAVARQLKPTYPDYLWYPSALANASHSAKVLSLRLAAAMSGSSYASSDMTKFIRESIFEDGLGITDASEDEVQMVFEHAAGSAFVLSDMVSRRAQVGWSTRGHSATDVNIYGSAGTEALRGNHENTEIGKFLAEYLDLDLESVTKRLRAERVEDNTLIDLDQSRGTECLTLPHEAGIIDCYHRIPRDPV